MSGIIEAIGLLAGTLGLVSFGLNNLPSDGEASGVTVRVHAGLGESDSQTMGGDIYQVFGFDYYNNFLGQTTDLSFHVEDGGYADITVNQDIGETVASRYVDLKAGHDATCIVYVGTTQPDGYQRTWLGDVGYMCGQSYYESGFTVGTDGDGNNYQPYCTWLDGNGDPTNTVGMKIDTEYYEVKDSHVDPQMDICGGTQWSEDYWPIPDKRGVSNKKRPAKHDNILVVSSFKKSSAIDLCGHGNSMGPDFVALEEGAFCDMDAKQVYPLCSDELRSDCFDVDSGDLVNSAGKVTRDGPRYEKFINW